MEMENELGLKLKQVIIVLSTIIVPQLNRDEEEIEADVDQVISIMIWIDQPRSIISSRVEIKLENIKLLIIPLNSILGRY